MRMPPVNLIVYVIMCLLNHHETLITADLFIFHTMRLEIPNFQVSIRQFRVQDEQTTQERQVVL